MFVDWFVPVYLLVSVLVLAGFGACLYFLEPGLQDAHKWSNKSIKHQPLVPTLNTHRDDDSSALIWQDEWRRDSKNDWIQISRCLRRRIHQNFHGCSFAIRVLWLVNIKRLTVKMYYRDILIWFGKNGIKPYLFLSLGWYLQKYNFLYL